jgi:hypothetical protein
MITSELLQKIEDAKDVRNKPPNFFKDPALKSGIDSERQISARPGRQVSARIFPNGEFGVGFVPHRGISAKDRRYERDRRYAIDNAEIEPTTQISPDGERIIYTRHYVQKIPDPKLGIGSESSHVRKKYGLKGITSYGRKMLRNAGDLLDKACANRYNRRVVMGTLTVPSYSPDTMKAICSNWGDIVRKFFQRIKRHYARHRYAFDYAGCTEIQPARLQNRSEVGLHLHFLFVAIRLGRGKWVLGDNLVRRVWGETIDHYLGQDDTSQNPNYRREDVSKSSAGYIAKYMSKGTEQVRQVVEEFGEEWLPSQWWYMSAPVRKSILAHTIRSQGTIADMLLCICTNGMDEYYRYIRCSTLPTDANEFAQSHGCPSEIVLGYGGLLSARGASLFIPRNQSESVKRYLPRTLDTSGVN